MQPVVRLIVSATCSQFRLGPTPKRSNHMLIAGGLEGLRLLGPVDFVVAKSLRQEGAI